MNNNEFTGDFYDEDYFERGKQSGKGWLENYHWMPRRTFREAFAFIDFLELTDDSYVLEVGCAKGFLVRALRELEIKADGCDISTYALGFAPEGCWNCDQDWRWDAHSTTGYTHIVIKDMLEHLTKEQLPRMLKNMSKVAKKMMCVIPMGDNGVYRIPEYHTEISHLIAENEFWWGSMFYKSDWVTVKCTYHVPGLKDNWKSTFAGNFVYVLEYRGMEENNEI